MKKNIIVIFLLAAFAVNAQTEKMAHFGAKITADQAIEVTKVTDYLAKKDTVQLKLTGKVESVCQKKGCWMMMELADGKSMRVRFKDYEFFMPKDCAGKTVVIEGIAFNDVTTVEMLRHYAEDAKKSKEEIEKITQPEKNPAFEAVGVILYE